MPLNGLDDNLIEVLDALDALFKELGLQALLDELELEDLPLVVGCAALHPSLLNHACGADCLVRTALIQITYLYIV